VSRTAVKTYGTCAGRPADPGRRDRPSQERPQRARTMEGTSISRMPPALTCPRRAGIRQLEAGPLAGTRTSRPKRGLRGSRSTGHSGEPKKRRSPTAKRASAAAAVDRTEAGARAVKHAAVGGRMTARWSGVELGWTRGNTDPPRDRPRSRTPWVYSQRPAGSLRRWCRQRVLVT
jgi:hypothetical protein